MEIQKIFSNTEDYSDRIYSVLMDEDEVYLFSEYMEKLFRRGASSKNRKNRRNNRNPNPGNSTANLPSKYNSTANLPAKYNSPKADVLGPTKPSSAVGLAPQSQTTQLPGSQPTTPPVSTPGTQAARRAAEGTANNVTKEAAKGVAKKGMMENFKAWKAANPKAWKGTKIGGGIAAGAGVIGGGAYLYNRSKNKNK